MTYICSYRSTRCKSLNFMRHALTEELLQPPANVRAAGDEEERSKVEFFPRNEGLINRIWTFLSDGYVNDTRRARFGAKHKWMFARSYLRDNRPIFNYHCQACVNRVPTYPMVLHKVSQTMQSMVSSVGFTAEYRRIWQKKIPRAAVSIDNGQREKESELAGKTTDRTRMSGQTRCLPIDQKRAGFIIIGCGTAWGFC